MKVRIVRPSGFDSGPNFRAFAQDSPEPHQSGFAPIGRRHAEDGQPSLVPRGVQRCCDARRRCPEHAYPRAAPIGELARTAEDITTSPDPGVQSIGERAARDLACDDVEAREDAVAGEPPG